MTIAVSPAYELLLSMAVVLEESEADTYDIGREWIETARQRAGDDLIARIRAVSQNDCDTFIHLVALAHDTPAPCTIASFLDHLRQTDAVEIKLHLVQYYARDTRRMTPAAIIRDAVSGDAAAQAEFLRTSNPDWEPWATYLRAVLAADGEQLKLDMIDVLGEWAERVWEPESDTIMPILERDAEAKHDLMRDLAMEEFFTAATNGVEFTPRPGIDRVVMVPSFVHRPLVAHTEFGNVLLITFPVADESVSAETDAPPLRLVRLSKALGDEKRLRILRALSDGEKTLMELAETFGVAKTTMHHHMIVLRSAGLVSVGVGSKRYRLRQEMVPDVGALLSGYLRTDR